MPVQPQKGPKVRQNPLPCQPQSLGGRSAARLQQVAPDLVAADDQTLRAQDRLDLDQSQPVLNARCLVCRLAANVASSRPRSRAASETACRCTDSHAAGSLKTTAAWPIGACVNTISDRLLLVHIIMVKSTQAS